MNNFQIVVLGCLGGGVESNLSAYLLSNQEGKDFIALDAGSLMSGIEKAFSISGSKAKEFLVDHVKAYLISHAHLDHILGLVINSQLDGKKKIYGLEKTIEILRDHIFNGKIWPNCGNEGSDPWGLYHYHRLKEKEKTLIEGSSFFVTSFPLTHVEPNPSTAFLVQSDENYILYFGDTASDFDSKEKRLFPIWQKIAPLIDRGQLKAILLECSFAHSDKIVPHYGHLDTHKMMDELRILRSQCHSLEGVKVIVTHRKQMFREEDELEQIEKQLVSLNDLGIEFVFPKQGQKIIL